MSAQPREGVIGVIFNTPFLGGSVFSGQAERVVDHLEHVVRLVGADRLPGPGLPTQAVAERGRSA